MINVLIDAIVILMLKGVDGLDRMNEIRIEFCNNTFVDILQQPDHLSPEQLTCTIYESGVHKLGNELSAHLLINY